VPLRILGAGGCGVTFLCEERATGNRVVVKALHPENLDRDAGTVLRELGWVRELDHPIPARVRETHQDGHDGSKPFALIEHCDGISLETYIRAVGAMAPDDWFDLAWTLARGLQALHNRGVLHRNLRPDAVLIEEVRRPDTPLRRRVRLLDTALGMKR